MGDTGESFARGLVEEANRNHWLLVAPTIEYGDWTDPAQIAREEPMLIQSLSYLLDALPARTGVPTQPRVLLIGFSRGAQLAHRFAEFHPDRVSAVASLSAGTYTLPATSAGFPFGLRDLARYTGQIFDAARFHDVPFWVGVGADDTNPADLPHQWDRFLGSTRVERARSFQAALRAAGARATLVRFAGTPHALTGEMISSACAFLVGQDLVSF
jgi:pimeloyl-ACP methyl ester carboxylesterase